MILLATDYSSTAELTAAIDTYLSNAADIYVTKATYDISRGCDQTDFFINVLHHQVKNGYQDRVQFPGFEDYTTPAPSHTVAYLDGFNTTYGTAPSTYTEGTPLTITVISGNSSVQILNTDITLTFGTEVFTVTANAQGTATFTFTPTTQGSVTVTSALSSAASNAIALGYHGVSVDTSIYSIDSTATYGITLTTNNIAIGDAVSGFGAVTVADVTNALLTSAVSRLLFTKHATVEIGSLFYNPGVGGSLSYTITPVAGDYTFKPSSHFGQSKSIDDLRYNYAVTDSDGSPASTISNLITHTAETLAANGSFTGSIPISAAFNNPVLVVFTLTNAYNNVVLSSQNTAGLTSSITSASTFEPEDSIVVAFADDTNELPEVDGSYVYVQAYDTPGFTGSPLLSAQALVAAGNTATVTLAVSDSIDQDLYLKTGYASYNVTNAITVEYLADSPVDVTTVMTITPGVTHYSSSSQTITFTVAMVGGATRNDYLISIFAVEGSQTQTLFSSSGGGTTSYQFAANHGNLNGTDSIVLKVSVAEA